MPHRPFNPFTIPLARVKKPNDNRQPINPYPDKGLPSEFWGSPVYEATGDNAGQYGVLPGELYCPGFTGSTYAKNINDKVWIAIPTSGNLEQPFTPGQATVKVTKGRDLDKKKGAGQDGTRITFHGLAAAEVEIEILVWTPQQYKMLIDLWLVLFPGPTKRTVTSTHLRPIIESPLVEMRTLGRLGTTTDGHQQIFTPKVQQREKVTVKKTFTKVDVRAFDVKHPVLNLHQIKSLLFYEGSGPVVGPVPRSRVFTMKAVEFMTPKKDGDSTSTPVASKGSKLDPPKLATPGTNPLNWGPPK